MGAWATVFEAAKTMRDDKDDTSKMPERKAGSGIKKQRGSGEPSAIRKFVSKLRRKRGIKR
jgi:hypothetical protein